MTEYTTAQLAVKCSKSERQVQRWIQSGKLKARRIGESNRYEVSDEALVPFLPHEATDDLLDRLEALELKLEGLQGQNPEILLEHLEAATASELDSISARLNEMADRLDALERKVQERPATVRPARAEYHTSKSTSASSDLPDGLVPEYLFYHGVPANTAKRAMQNAGVQAVHGRWIVGGHHFDKALDAEGQRQAYEALHKHPRFKPCEKCPHQT